MSPLPPPSPADAATAPRASVVVLDPPPRAGELTLAWRITTAFTWIGVVLALAGVWNASVQLGLSTWWLGPRGDPQPRLVQLSPFVAPVLMVLGALNKVRWLSWFGLLAAAVTAAVGLGDLDRVGTIAATELAVAGAAAVVSLASLTGTYRDATGGRRSSPPVGTGREEPVDDAR